MTTGKWHSTCLTSENPEWRACHFLPPSGKAVSRLSFHWVGVAIMLFSIKSNEAAAQTWNLAVKSGLRQVGCRFECHFLGKVSFIFVVSG